MFYLYSFLMLVLGRVHLQIVGMLMAMLANLAMLAKLRRGLAVGPLVIG